MNVTKLSEDQLHELFSPELMLRAEGSIGQFRECTIKDKYLHGKIKGNHGVYTVEVNTSPVSVKCDCRKGSAGELCKHSAALGLSFVYTPWIFKCEDNVNRNKLESVEDVQFYIAVTPLKQLADELKIRGIGISTIAGMVRLPVQHVASAIKDSSNGIPNSAIEPLKVVCMYLLDRGISS